MWKYLDKRFLYHGSWQLYYKCLKVRCQCYHGFDPRQWQYVSRVPCSLGLMVVKTSPPLNLTSLDMACTEAKEQSDIFSALSIVKMFLFLFQARSEIISTFALCGFANLTSIGVQLGALGPMAPRRRGDIANIAMRALLGGVITCLITACIAGQFHIVIPPILTK